MSNDWRLIYPGTELVFGSRDSRFVFPVAPSVGNPDITTDDAARPRADGVAFGVDYLGGSTVTFEIDVDGTDEADARERSAILSQAWRADRVRQTPGAVATLVSDSGRITFGRPRRFALSNAYLPQGLAQATADFATADTLWYSAEESGTSVALVPAAGGGLIAPLASPLATTATSDRSQVFTVGGRQATWPVIEIRGPIVNPTIEVLGVLRMEFKISLAFDQSLVIDTRPWARSILRSGASVAGSLTRTSTRLSQAAIAPGTYELALRGTSDSGTAWASIHWRDAYLTP